MASNGNGIDLQEVVSLATKLVDNDSLFRRDDPAVYQKLFTAILIQLKMIADAPNPSAGINWRRSTRFTLPANAAQRIRILDKEPRNIPREVRIYTDVIVGAPPSSFRIGDAGVTSEVGLQIPTGTIQDLGVFSADKEIHAINNATYDVIVYVEETA